MIGKVTSHKPPLFTKTKWWGHHHQHTSFQEKQPSPKGISKKKIFGNQSRNYLFTISATPKSPKNTPTTRFLSRVKTLEEIFGEVWAKNHQKKQNIYIYIIQYIYIYYILRKKYIAMGPNSPARFGKKTAPLTRTPFVTSGLPTHCTNIGELVHGVHTSKACHGETMGIEGKPGRFSHISQMRISMYGLFTHIWGSFGDKCR